MTTNLYLLLFMLSSICNCKSQLKSDVLVQQYREEVYGAVKNRQINILESINTTETDEQKVKFHPLQSAAEQLSIFNSLLNSVILAESIGQNSTTFGEIGVNFMLVQNMLTDKNGISTIDSKNIRMENDGDLQKLMENGFDGNVSIDVIEKIMMIEEGISEIDALSKAFETINNIKKDYENNIDFKQDGFNETLQFLDTLPKVLSSMSRLSTGSTLIDAFTTGAKLIKHYESINVEAMKRSYESCKITISSQDCSSGFEVFRNITVSEDSIESIEAVDVIFDFVSSPRNMLRLTQLLTEQKLISSMHVQLSKFQSYFGSPVDFESLMKSISNMFISITELKTKKSELQEIAKTLEIFRPVSNAIVRMRNEHQVHSQKRIKNTNEYSTDVIDTIRRLPGGGIVDLAHLSEIIRKSGPLLNEYQNSKVVERMKIMHEFTTQRVDFLKFSDGVGSVHHISTIIRNIELFISQVSNYTWLEEEVKIILQENNRLASVENVVDGIMALKDVENRLNSLNKENWKKFTNVVRSFKLSSDRKVIFEIFSELASLVRLAKKVNNLIRTNGKADETIFNQAIEAAEKISTSTNKTEQILRSMQDKEVEAMRMMITESNPKSVNVKNGERPIAIVINGFQRAMNAHTKIKNILKSDNSQLASGFVKLEKLKTDVPRRPSQKELNAFKPMMTQLNSLKKLKISSAYENSKLCPELTILAKSQNNDLLGDVSKGFNQYRRLIKGIPSVASLQSEKVEASVKELLDGVEAIQILVAKDEIGAYDVFYSWQMIDERLGKLVKYLETTEKRISSNGLRDVIIGKANSSRVHLFLSRLDGPAATSISDMRSSISVILTGLKNSVGCGKIGTSSPGPAVDSVPQRPESTSTTKPKTPTTDPKKKEKSARFEKNSGTCEKNPKDVECPRLCEQLKPHEEDDYGVGTLVIFGFAAVFFALDIIGIVLIFNKLKKKEKKREKKVSTVGFVKKMPVVNHPKFKTITTCPDSNDEKENESSDGNNPLQQKRRQQVSKSMRDRFRLMTRRHRLQEASDKRDDKFKKMGKMFFPLEVDEGAFEQHGKFPEGDIVLDKITYNPSKNERFYIGSEIDDVEYAPSEVSSTDSDEENLLPAPVPATTPTTTATSTGSLTSSANATTTLGMDSSTGISPIVSSAPVNAPIPAQRSSTGLPPVVLAPPQDHSSTPAVLLRTVPNSSSAQASSANTPSQLPNPAPNASGPSQAVSSKSKKGDGPKVEKSSKNNQSKRK